MSDRSDSGKISALPDWKEEEVWRRWSAEGGCTPPVGSPSPLRTGSTNALGVWGDWVLKLRPSPGSFSAQRELRMYRRFGGIGVIPRLVGAWGDGGNGPAVLVFERLEGKSVWEEWSSFSPERIGEVLSRRMGEWFQALGRFHRETGTVGEKGELRGVIHGDFHLGQLFRTPENRMYVLDFEGLPGEGTPDEGDPLIDVAGLWRSLDYLLTVRGEDPEGVLTSSQAEEMLEVWIRSVGGEGEAAWNRISPADRRRRFVEKVTERNLWEIEYEKKHRPEWRSVPEAGLQRSLRLFPDGVTGKKEEEGERESPDQYGSEGYGGRL